MRSAIYRGRKTLLTLACATLALTVTACGTLTPTIPPALAEWRCDSWIADEIKDDVPGVDLPDGTLGGQIVAFDGQTGRLDQANDEKRTVLAVNRKCEDIRADLFESLAPRTLWQRLTPW